MFWMVKVVIAIIGAVLLGVLYTAGDHFVRYSGIFRGRKPL